MINGTMMQYFEWYLPADGTLWRKCAENAGRLAEKGITSVWLPPAFKGAAGSSDAGYGVYDLYDLGEFDQKGSVRTKYGTKDEYLAAIRAFHQAGIYVYADMVFDHKMGADYTEKVTAVETNESNRLEQTSGEEGIEAWTGFNFPGRGNTYSDFKWDSSCFNGVDWDQRQQKHAIYNFTGKPWDPGVAKEFGNYDYLMGADLSFREQKVVDELDRFGRWYLDFTGVDGFRLDAVKHIDSRFFPHWLGKLREDTGRELFAVGEYWSPDLGELEGYEAACSGCMSLFDVPLHMNFFNACHAGGNYDMRTIFDHTLVKDNPEKAVTFVANHDTQKGQALQTVIENWFKPIAYSLILLRPQGYPCVFYGDYYGVETTGVPPQSGILDILLRVRRDKIYGTFHDYLDDPNVIGWTLEGDSEHPDSGAAVLVDDGPEGGKRMYVGKQHAGRTFRDVAGGRDEAVTIDAEGYGDFRVSGGNISVWTVDGSQ
ncbi:MAG: alpha-amylase [Anaerovoracaceae bacterium]